MPDRNLVLSLAKVALAAAWADGQISLYLPRKAFIDATVKIPVEPRAE